MSDPDDVPSTAPLVSVLYDPGALGDRGYNDLVYRGVENAAYNYGLRALQLSPTSEAEGLATLQTILDQMSVPQDTVRRLFIVAGASYDSYLRENNRRLENNPYADLLYLETSLPLEGKGSTLYLPYYGAMYEAGAIAHAVYEDVLLIGANPKVESVRSAVDGFTDGFNAGYPHFYDDGQLVTCWLSDDASGGFSIADSTAIRIMNDRAWESVSQLIVPVCGGAAGTFQRMCDMFGRYDYMGIDTSAEARNCPCSIIKHIDRAISVCIEQWLSSEGMPKHQRLSFADGYTEVILHPYTTGQKYLFEEMLTDGFFDTMYEDAVKKEAEYGL